MRQALIGEEPLKLFEHVRSEEHTSELQSRFDLVCRLLLEKKKKQPKYARVAKGFVTKDRSEAVFTLRMIEARRTKYRVDVVNDLRSVCRTYGFKDDLVGGI